MINVSELINDPDFSFGTFAVIRSIGTWVDGVFTTTTTTLTPSGTIQPLTSKDIEQLPVGDAIKGGCTVWTLDTLYPTRLDSGGETGGLSDVVTYQGVTHKVMQTRDFIQHGYNKYICIRLDGA